ncbi:hypothetical protein D3C71_1352440 [compost metagenome]
MQETERSQAVIDRYDHDPALGSEDAAVEHRLAAGARQEGAAVNPYHDRQRFILFGRRPDVKMQAVLREDGLLAPEPGTPGIGRLKADGSEGGRIPDAFPG